MQEEVTQKSIALVIRTSKLTADVLKKAMIAYLNHLKNKQANWHGKISVKKLMGKDQGANTMEITENNIKSFERVAKKYNVDFAVKKDKTVDESKDEDITETTAQTSGVDPDLKAFLDSYEEFVDEYVVFMKKYMADPTNAVSMLSEYSEIMGKYSDFAEKVDQYDSKEMSTEDAKYYLEVTTRCSQKMLDIYSN